MKRDTIHIMLFAGFLLLGGSLCVFHPARDFSEMENRKLTAFPGVLASGIADGEFQRDFERAAGDQIALRDQMVHIATGMRYLLGERSIGGVYIGEGGRYFEEIRSADISQKRLSTNVSVIEKLSEDHPDVRTTLFLAPTDSVVGGQLLPEGAPLYDDARIYEEIREASSTEVIYEPGEFSPEDYFATDHHWNTHGALIGSRLYLKSVGKTLEEDFSYETAGEPFFGTLYSKAPLFSCKGEDFMYPVTEQDYDITVEGEKRDGFFERSYLDKKDKYALYFGGNHSIVEIDNPGASGGVLLVVKDSFFNSAVPYLAPHYSRIVMVDLRYFNESFGELIERVRPDELLFFYEMSDFAGDENFSKLIR